MDKEPVVIKAYEAICRGAGTILELRAIEARAKAAKWARRQYVNAALEVFASTVPNNFKSPQQMMHQACWAIIQEARSQGGHKTKAKTEAADIALFAATFGDATKHGADAGDGQKDGKQGRKKKNSKKEKKKKKGDDSGDAKKKKKEKKEEKRKKKKSSDGGSSEDEKKRKKKKKA